MHLDGEVPWSTVSNVNKINEQGFDTTSSKVLTNVFFVFIFLVLTNGYTQLFNLQTST